MNKETRLLNQYILDSGFYLDKIDQTRKKYRNIKDFQNQFLYILMEIVSEEKKFFNISRKNIDVPSLTNMYFY